MRKSRRRRRTKKRRTKKRRRKRRTKKRRRKRRGGVLGFSSNQKKLDKDLIQLREKVEELLTKYENAGTDDWGDQYGPWAHYGPNGKERALTILSIFDYILSDDEKYISKQKESSMARAELYIEIRELVKRIVNNPKQQKLVTYEPIVDTMTENRTSDSFDMENPDHVISVLVGRKGQLEKKW